ncbi:sodium-dependent transporter [Bacillus alveayuensis]|uniref:sodium-dependent transporter n=1 Tax=Aeribacillus alveayuensis TaxID=279215 RepID=UPI0005CC929B|nr:sodium-dependent transporter [Bacillus alveayuensis]
MQQNEQWSSKLGFILASAGSAIGIGAIWKLPYVTGMSGGGAFFLIFVLFSVLIGLPLLLGEFMIGRSAQREAPAAYSVIAPNTNWHWLGYLGIVTCFILLSFYSVVGGWIVAYLVNGLTGKLSDSAIDYAILFQETISSPVHSILAQGIFLLITVYVISKGVQKGIENANKLLMPLLFILFLVLIVRSLTLGGAVEGISFFLKPDFSKLSSEGILFALGQSFFSLSVGASVMVTYSSYLSKNESLLQSASYVVVMNLFISILAGLAIFPAVFSLNMEPAAGPGLLFIVLPSVFREMVLGSVFFLLFLALFLFATLTSAFSMLEIIIASLAKGNSQARKKLAWVVGSLIFLVGIPSNLSFSLLQNITIFHKTIFDAADFLVSNILLPIGALLISIFIPLKMKKSLLYDEFTRGGKPYKLLFHIWYILMKYIVPIVIIIVFLDSIGII